MPSIPKFLDKISGEFDVPRDSLATIRPLRIFHFYEETFFRPTGEKTAYTFKVMNLSHLAVQLPNDEFVSQSGKRYRWISMDEIKAGKTTDNNPIAAEIWQMLQQTPEINLQVDEP